MVGRTDAKVVLVAKSSAQNEERLDDATKSRLSFMMTRFFFSIKTRSWPGLCRPFFFFFFLLFLFLSMGGFFFFQNISGVLRSLDEAPY